MIFELDDIIPFSLRHKGETIRQIIRYDSGYLKDLFLRDERVCFSVECFDELVRLTKNHEDNWEKGRGTGNVFHQLKPYVSPYLFSFDDINLRMINEKRLEVDKDNSIA